MVVYWVGITEDWMTSMHLSGAIRDLVGCFINAASEFYAENSSIINEDAVLGRLLNHGGGQKIRS